MSSDVLNFLIGSLTLGVAVLSIINGWVLFAMRSTQATTIALQKADKEMSMELSAVKVLVAQSYLTRSEFQTSITAQTSTLTRSIERLEEKMDRKADKGPHNRRADDT